MSIDHSSNNKLLQTTPDFKEFNMPGDSTTSASLVLDSTTLAYVFRKHLELATGEDDVQAKIRNAVPTLSPEQIDSSTDEHKSSQFDDRIAEISQGDVANVIHLENVITQPMLSHAGKVLVCLNGALPVLSHVNGVFILNTVVEGINSNKVARLEVICSLQEAAKLSISLKNPYLRGMEPNSRILIHNPVFKRDYSGKYLSICSGKVQDIVFLGQATHHSLFDRGQQEAGDRNDNDNESSTYSSDDESGSEEGKSRASLWAPFSSEEKYVCEGWKEWGNTYSLRRMHSLALIAYTIAQRFQPSSTELVAAKSASLINLGLYAAALKHVDTVGLQEDPFNTGFISRRLHCLWGLGRYEEAIEYLKDCLERLMSTEREPDEVMRKGMFIQQLMTRTEKIVKQRNNPDLLDNEGFFKTQTKLSYDDPEYYMSISLIANKSEQDIPKYRKIAVANQDVQAGMLLAVTKAFIAVSSDYYDETDNTNDRDDSTHDELLNLVMQKILIEKPSEAEFYKLQEMSSEKINLSKNDIVEFCNRYEYENYDTTGVGLSQSQKRTKGIWTFPQNIGHACVGGNAIWYICGNVMFIRAISDIKDGEEILMAHVVPTEPYEIRTEFLRLKGIHCTCTLCQFEKLESDQTKTKRSAILTDMHFKGYKPSNFSSEPLPSHEIRKLKHRIEDLETLRGAYAKLNFPIVEPLYNCGLYLMKIENFDEAIIAFEKAFFVVDNTTAIFALIRLSFLLSYCYTAKKKGSNKTRAKKWFRAMQSYISLSYGSLLPVKSIFKAEFEYLKRKGIAS